MGRGHVAWHATQYKNHHFENDVNEKKTRPTKKGEKVQSFGEEKIANFLFTHDIDYIYDLCLKLDEDEPEDKNYWVRPDFLLEGTKIVIEYWGMNCGPKNNPTYTQKAARKKALYEQEGYILIEIFYEDQVVLEDYLMEKLREQGFDI